MAGNYNYFEGLTIRNTDVAFLARYRVVDEYQIPVLDPGLHGIAANADDVAVSLAEMPHYLADADGAVRRHFVGLAGGHTEFVKKGQFIIYLLTRRVMLALQVTLVVRQWLLDFRRLREIAMFDI